jgi:hypothetical protein
MIAPSPSDQQLELRFNGLSDERATVKSHKTFVPSRDLNLQPFDMIDILLTGK